MSGDRRRWTWLVALCLLLAAIGEVGWAIAELTELPAPATLATVTHVLVYAVALTGAARLVGPRVVPGDRGALLDSGIVALAMTGVLWDLIAVPALRAGLPAEQLVRVVPAPVLAIVAAAVVLRLVRTGVARNVSAWCLLAAIASVLGAAQLTVASGGLAAPTGTTIGALWGVGYLAGGLGLLHPSLGELLRPAGEPAARATDGRLLVVGLSLLALPLSMVATGSGTRSSPGALVATVLCVGLVVWRLGLLLAEQERSRHELQRRTRHESALAQLSAGALQAGDVHQLIARSAHLTGDAIGVPDVDMRLVDPTMVPREPGPAPPDKAADAARVLTLDVPGQRPLDPVERDFVSSACNLVANAVLRRAAEAKSRHQAMHDVLTGLPNRPLFLDRLEHAIARFRRDHGSCVVLFIDLDGFKAINGSYGHAAGDQILVVTAHRLTSLLRPGDTVARFSGDEFVVLCENATASGGLRIAERLKDTLGAPVRLPPLAARGAVASAPARTATVGASIGVAVARQGDDPELILQRADAAMHEAKSSGSGRVVVATGLTTDAP